MMKEATKYSEKDRQHIAWLVSTLVKHPVDCATADARWVGLRKNQVAFQIMPAMEVEHKSPVKEFWWESNYCHTQQFWDSPVAAGLHYATHFLAFIQTNRNPPS
ncbi:hypothetical protein GO755_24645 [Spirosoma sp. HMF4905]|uniref:Uncharacterized protein n=1 Tax=Spirosoma arboris TaxID=2682092 RepID=A0A7K1SHI5_9BACT|nr:hypothetical protein [Spirosoma arboris]MVM33252.1 hypothetical protein [Spirosoma arboris]